MMCYQKVSMWFLPLLWCIVFAAVLESSEIQLLNSDVASNAVGVEENGDVKLFDIGWINLTLDYPYKLEFGVCKNKCLRKSIVCYPSSSSNRTGNDDFCTDLPSFCGFKVEVDGDSFNFWKEQGKIIGFPFFPDECPSFVMASPEFQASGHPVPSCDPKLDENHMIQLYVMVHPSCPIWVKKAKIYLPPPTTTTVSTTEPVPPPEPAAPASSLSATSDSASTSFVSEHWWIFLIVAIVLVILIGIIIFVIYKMRPKFMKQKPANAAPIQSAKMKSVPINLELSEKSKKSAVEYPADSLNQNRQIPPPVLEDMKKNYKIVPNRDLLDEEVGLIYMPIETMDETLNEYSQGCKQKLSSSNMGMGVKFDKDYKIEVFPDKARHVLNNAQTPASLAYFAFGVEYCEYIPNNAQDLQKFSLPLLMVIALQPHFNRRYRRQAMACLRRRLPEIRDAYSAAEREAMPFPANAIEMVYQSHPKYFKSLKKCVTADTTVEESEKTIENFPN